MGMNLQENTDSEEKYKFRICVCNIQQRTDKGRLVTTLGHCTVEHMNYISHEIL